MTVHRRSKGFKDLYLALPERERREAVEAYHLMVSHPKHVSLRLHYLDDVKFVGPENTSGKSLISVAVAWGYRAVALVDSTEGVWIWFWIGSHGIYDLKFKRGTTIHLPVS